MREVLDTLKNIDLERRVIGGAVTDMARMKRARDAGLSANVFTLEEARAVWKTMEELDNQREAFDAAKIMARLPALSVFLAECQDSTPTFALFDDWAVDLRNLAAARMADAALLDARAKLAEEPLKPEKIQTILEALSASYQQKATGRTLPTLKETGRELLDQWQGKTVREIPLLKGLRGIFFAGELFVLAASTGKGKTAFAASAVNNMLDNGLSVFYFCSESSRADILARIVAARCGVFHGKMRDKTATKADINVTMKAFSEIMGYDEKLRIYGPGDGAMTPKAIRMNINQMIAKWGRVDVFVIDYLQDFDSDEKRANMTQTNVMEDVTKQIQRLAAETNAGCLALSQYNKDGDKTFADNKKENNNEPQLWWLKDSSKIAQAAHVVASLWLKDNSFRFKCLKRRNCNSFDVELKSNGAGFYMASPSPIADAADIPPDSF